MEHINRLDVELENYKIDAELWIDGVLFEEGILTIQSSTSKVINCVFQNKAISLFKDLDKISTKEIGLPVITLPSRYLPDANLSITQSITTQTKVVIGIDGNIYEEDLSNFSNLIIQINNDFPGLTVEFVYPPNNYNLQIKTTDPDNLVTIDLLPGPYNPAIYAFFKQVVDYQDGLSQVNVRLAWIDHLANIQINPTTHVFPTIHSPNFYNSSFAPPAFQGYSNNSKEGVYNIYFLESPYQSIFLQSSPACICKNCFTSADRCRIYK